MQLCSDSLASGSDSSASLIGLPGTQMEDGEEDEASDIDSNASLTGLPGTQMEDGEEDEDYASKRDDDDLQGGEITDDDDASDDDDDYDDILDFPAALDYLEHCDGGCLDECDRRVRENAIDQFLRELDSGGSGRVSRNSQRRRLLAIYREAEAEWSAEVRATVTRLCSSREDSVHLGDIDSVMNSTAHIRFINSGNDAGGDQVVQCAALCRDRRAAVRAFDVDGVRALSAQIAAVTGGYDYRGDEAVQCAALCRDRWAVVIAGRLCEVLALNTQIEQVSGVDNNGGGVAFGLACLYADRLKAMDDDRDVGIIDGQIDALYEAMLAAETTWPCQECNATNPIQEENCRGCGRRRGEAVDLAWRSELLRPRPGDRL
jgi:hypothetical protein